MILSQSSSIAQQFNFPQRDNQITFSTNQSLQYKFKKKYKNNIESNDEQFKNKQEQQKQKQKHNFYFKIQVIKKVGTFLQNLKSGIVFQKPNLKLSELYYLQSQAKLDQKSNLFAYQNIWVIIFEIIFFILLGANIWKNSFQLVFNKLFDDPYVQLITLGFYLLHVYLFLNTQFKNEKLELITNQNTIFQYYLNEKIFYDAIIVILIILQSTPLDQIQALQYVFRISSILLIKPFNQISIKLQNIMSKSTDTQIMVSIMSLIFKIFLLLHSLSLLLTILSDIQNKCGIQQTWVSSDQNKLNINTDIQLYISGWYWASTILSTVGFGDIKPVNHAQRAFISFIQVLGCIMTGFFVNFIGSLINMVGQSKKNYQKDMRRVNRYLIKQELPDLLKSNIRSHFFNKYKIQQVYDPNTQETILKKLSTSLSSQIIETRNYRIISLSKFLTPFTQSTIKKLSNVAKKMVFAPQQIIFSQKSIQKKVWILQDGIVQQIPTFYNSKQDKLITTYDKDNQRTIGWINFLTDRAYRTMARAKTFTLSYEINQDDFFRILKESKSDFFKMHQLKQTLIQKKREYINKCLSCQRFTHNVLQCPKIHFKSKGTFKILAQEKKLLVLKGEQQRKKNLNRSQVKLNWKSFEYFSQITPQIQEIIAKYHMKNVQIDQLSDHTNQIQSFVHKLYNKKSSYQQKIVQQRQSSLLQSHKAIRKSYLGDNAIQNIQIPIIDLIDKVYLGQQNGYMQNNNFHQISKKYVLYMINWCTNRNKINQNII